MPKDHGYATPEKSRTGKKPARNPQRRAGQIGGEHMLHNSSDTVEHVLRLQRTIGNQATQMLISRTSAPSIQRLPSPSMVRDVLGDPHKDRKLFGKRISKQSTKYKAVLDALKGYNDFILKQKVSMMTLGGLMSHYDSVETSVKGYLADKEDKWVGKNKSKINYIRQLLGMITNERAIAMQVAARYSKMKPSMTPTWHIALASAQKAPKIIEDEDVTGQVGGGSNVLDMVGEEGEGGYFKQNLDVVPNAELASRANPEGMKDDLKGTGLENKYANALLNLEITSLDAGIIPDYKKMYNLNYFTMGEEKAQELYQHFGPAQKGGINLARRDIATSRLNNLLGAGVIANTEMAFRRTGEDGELKEGSLMEKAKGSTPDDLKFGTESGPGTVNINDPNLQRMMSRLQLLDALAFQVDRNLSNFYLQTDEHGNVLAVTGIDNDMSFGQFALEIGQRGSFPGLSRFVDAEMARAILDLDPQMLDWALADLLSEAELVALKTRLELLQDYLKGIEKELLEPDMWNEATSKGMLDEKSSYYAEMVRSYYKPGNK
jgi:hypothetical protein